jgi:hypothetical protein
MALVIADGARIALACCARHPATIGTELAMERRRADRTPARR